MSARGRLSLASVETPNARPKDRPEPPSELTEEQAEEWCAVVNRMPPDWFPRETHALLVQYCRHVVTLRKIAMLIKQQEDAEQFNVDAYDRLLKMQDREGRALSSLATRMRLSQHSTYDRKKTKGGGTGAPKPWDK